MSFIKHTLGLFISNVFVVLASFVLGILTARFLEPAGKGQLYLALQIIALSTVVLSGGFGPTYQFFISSGKEAYNRIIAFAISQVLTITLLLILGLLSFGLYFHVFFVEIVDFRLSLLISIGIVLNVVNLFTSSVVLSSSEGITIHSKLIAIGAIVNLLAVYFMIIAECLTFQTALIANYLGLSSQIIARLFIIFGKGIVLDFSNLIPLTRKLIMFAAPSFITNVALILVFKINTFFIVNMLGAESMGVFSMSIAFAEISLVLPNTVGTVIFTKTPSLKQSEKLDMLLKSNRTIILIAFISSLFITFLAPLIVNLLLGIEYAGAVKPLQFLAPGLIFMASNYAMTNFFTGNGRPWLVARIYMISVILNVVLNYVLISKLALIGASLSAGITYLAMACMFYFHLLKNNSVSMKKLLVFTSTDLLLLRTFSRSMIVRDER